MDQIRKKVSALKESVAEITLSQDHLKEFGLQGITLRKYQLYGVVWMKSCSDRGNGCILGDEMGLGKTIQTISFLTLKNSVEMKNGPFLVLCPLSVLKNWETELKRYAPVLKVLVFTGDKESREEIKLSLKDCINNQGCGWSKAKLPFTVLLTTYEICLKDASFLKKFSWKVLVVDEAHRLKNTKSLLHQELDQFRREFSILLTGTPVQNNLKELYSLLSFVEPGIFEEDLSKEFVESYSDVSINSGKNAELQKLLSPFLLRRVKSEVMADLPRKSEVILYTGLSELQKKYYKAILMKDLGAFSTEGTTRTRLMNILVQLRKCVNHPYLFDGVEPEPFKLGDHLINASGKLHLIDQLLKFLKQRGHKVLLFSQMTRMLDIVQDYLGYRGYTYERLDGSVRGEERFLAIENFNEDEDTFIFLLSTRAGGQGLNLVSADTVIFVDSDFNPQNDLQAAARAHRIGQTRPVKVIRLVGRSTVEEIILRRADEKLKLTNKVIEGGQFSGVLSSLNQIAETQNQLADILKFGLDKLFESKESSITEEELEKVLGCSCHGEWIHENDIDKHSNGSMEINEPNKAKSMYVYEGKDYSKEELSTDSTAFDKLAEEMIKSITTSDRTLRSEKKIYEASSACLPIRKRRVLTPEEIEQRKIKRQETMAKRAKLKEEEESRKTEELKKKLEKLWHDNGYSSCNISLKKDDHSESESSDSEEDMFSDEMVDHVRDIHYIQEDVTQPQKTSRRNAIIVHCVDDSGSWGKGGLFSALAKRSSKPEVMYELASRMKDLYLGDAHLIPIDNITHRDGGEDHVALIVAQTRDRHQRLSGIKLSALSLGLRRVARAAKDMNATVHLPRIGHSTPNFNWYGTERLIRKHLAAKGIHTSIYYYPRSGAAPNIVPCSKEAKEVIVRRCTSSKSQSESAEQKVQSLSDFLTGVVVYFVGIPEEDKKKLRRYVIAFNGDVESSCCDLVTHVVCDDGAKVNVDPPEGALLVTRMWLENCLKQKRLLSTTAFEMT